MPSSPSVADVFALVLAGGQSSRMGGRDKGLQPWRGGTLAGHAASRLRAEDLTVRVSANRHLADYTALGLAPLPDTRPGFAGPLAALETGLFAAAQGGHDWLLAVPCDSPLFPPSLPRRLLDAVGTCPAAFACQGPAVHPAFCVLSVTLAGTLTRYLDDGGRRMRDWWSMVGAAPVDFSDQADWAFANANTPEDLVRLQAMAEVAGC